MTFALLFQATRAEAEFAMSDMLGKQSGKLENSTVPAHSRRILTADDILEIRRRRSQKEHRSDDDRPFKDADAHEADLSGMDWSGEDFSGSDLHGANLSRCTFAAADFCDADLWNANLRDSDLSRVRNLLPAQLAATDLTRATLPEELLRFDALHIVESLTQNATRIFVTILLAAFYTLLTIATTKDILLLMNTGVAKLPVIDLEIPMLGFLGITPVILLGFFLYFHLLLLRLCETTAKLPAIFRDGRRIDEVTPLWLMSDLVQVDFPRLNPSGSHLAWLQRSIACLLGWGLVPITLLAIWATSLRTEMIPMIAWETSVFGVSVGFSIVFARLLQRAICAREAPVVGWSRALKWLSVGWGVPVTAVVLCVFGLCSLGIYVADSIPESKKENRWHIQSEPERQKLLYQAVLEKKIQSEDNRGDWDYLVSLEEERQRIDKLRTQLALEGKRLSRLVELAKKCDAGEKEKSEKLGKDVKALESQIATEQSQMAALEKERKEHEGKSSVASKDPGKTVIDLARLRLETGQPWPVQLASEGPTATGNKLLYWFSQFWVRVFDWPSGLHSFYSVDSGDIAGKPASWTGVPEDSEKELALVPGARLEERRLRRLHAINAFLAKTNFTNADLTGAQLDYADLRGAILRWNQAQGARFNFAAFGDQLPPHDLKQEDKLNAQLDEKAFEEFYKGCQKYHLAALDGTVFSNAHFAGANLARLKVQNCKFSEANFESGNLVHTDCVDCDFKNSIFNLACIEDAVFRVSSFDFISPRENFSLNNRVDMSGATFTAAYGSGVRFLGCMLDYAVFAGADLSKSTFAQCSLEGASFVDADLSDADLTTASGLNAEQLKKAASLSNAQLPDDLAKELADRTRALLPKRKKPLAAETASRSGGEKKD